MAFEVITSEGVEVFPDPVNPPTHVCSNWCCHATQDELTDAGISCCIEEGECMEGPEEFGYSGYGPIGSMSASEPMSMLDFELSPELRKQCEMLGEDSAEFKAIKFHCPRLVPGFSPAV